LEKQPLIFIGNIKLVYYIINQFDDHALQDVGVNDEQFLNKYIYVHHKYIYLGKNKINFLQIKEVIK
jgi:Flp pilus assembly CpaF family ATPase